LGSIDSYQIQIIDKRAKYWPGYEGRRMGEPAGSGRVFSKKLLEAVNYTPFNNDKNSSLDSSAIHKIRKLGWPIWEVFSLKEEGLVHAGMKSHQDKNRYTAIPADGNKLHFKMWIESVFDKPERIIKFRAKTLERNPHA